MLRSPIPLVRAGLALSAVLVVCDQAPAQSRFEFKPSLAAIQVYDDNLFSTPSARVSDYIWRLSPGLGIRHRSTRFTLGARYSMEAERFRQHTDLNRAVARQDAVVDLSWSATRRLTFTASGGYAEAQTPGDLNVVTGLEAGRIPARRLSTTQALSHRLGALTKLTLDHAFYREEIEGRPRNDSQAAGLGLERQMGPLDVGRMRYGAQRFVLGPAETLSHVLTLGWSRKVTPRTRFEFDAGPRLSAGHQWSADVAVGLSSQLRHADVGLAYLQTQTTVLGEAGPVKANGLTATVGWQLLRSFRIALGPALFRVRGPGTESTVSRAGAEATLRLSRRLSLAAGHTFSFQRGNLGFTRGGIDEITHNTFVIRLAAAPAAADAR